MTAAVGVLVVHGMGVQQPGFSAGFEAAVRGRLRALAVPDAATAWEEGYWADLLNARQAALLGAMRRGGPLDYLRLRHFVVEALADAVAYRRGGATTAPDEPGRWVYDEIHERLCERLTRLRAHLGDADRPLVLLAHSLGSVIVSDHVWDHQHPKGLERGTTPFERMRTVAGIVTFGSTIPLFTLALPAVRAIRFPLADHALPPAVHAASRWLNLYDRDDVLGWPLRPLSPSYAAAVAEDREVDVGGPLTSWNPASHGAYWRDADVVQPVAELLRDVVAAAGAAPAAP